MAAKKAKKAKKAMAVKRVKRVQPRIPAKKKPAATRKPAKKPPTKAAPKKPAASAAPPRAPGERRYWLLKTEPDVFSFDDLLRAPDRTTYWDGVRNYQARNTLRDDMKAGDLVLVYHSNAEPPGVAGIAEVAREGYPDHTQFDPADVHFDPGAKADAPTWFMVDVRAVRPLARLVSLPELREVPGLEKMVLLQKGSRLSVQPVSAREFEIVTGFGG